MQSFSEFFKKLLTVAGIILVMLTVFVVVRIYLNNQKEAARRQEAQKNDIPLAEAQKLDLGGASEGDFMTIREPENSGPAPSPQQWRNLLAALSKGTEMPMLLPEKIPFASAKLGNIRYATGPGSYQIFFDCRSTIPEEEINSCGAVSLSVTRLIAEDLSATQNAIKLLAREPAVEYAAIHTRGTDGLDKPIRYGARTLVYNEFCSEIGCNGSVFSLAGNLQIRVEGSGDLEPWYKALLQKSAGDSR